VEYCVSLKTAIQAGLNRYMHCLVEFAIHWMPTLEAHKHHTDISTLVNRKSVHCTHGAQYPHN